MLAAVACDDEPRPSATPEPTTPTPEGRQEQPQQPTNPPTPELLSATPTVEVGQEEPTQPVTPPTPPATELLVPTPTPVIQEHPPPPHWGASGPSLDGAIFSADVIVLGSLSSIESGSMTIPSGEGVQPTYRPLAEMRFDVVEYLKGSGSRTIVVEAPDRRNTYLMEQEAVSAAEAMVASRDAAHDGSEMIVFLRNELDQDSGRVTRAASDSGDRFRWQSIHTIVGPDAGNSPSQDGSSGEDSSGSSDGSLQFVHYTQPLWTDEGSVDISDLLAFSLTELRSRIEAMDALLKAGEGVEGYKFCISQKLVSERHLRVRWTPKFGQVAKR